MSPEEALFSKLQAVGEKKPTVPPEERPSGEPTESKPVTLRNLFTHPDAHPVVLDFALLKSFANDWHRWEPETLFDEVKETFQTQISELCRHKMRALQIVHVSPFPWMRWHIFEKVAHTLNGSIPDFQTMQQLSLEELYAAVDILDTLRKDMQFSDEVKLYMAGTVLNEDVFFVPPPLDFIQLEVSQPHYHCNDCGNEDSALFSDGFCSNCTERMHPLQGLTLQPMRERVNEGKGKNLTITVRYDPAPILKRWETLKDAHTASFAPDMNSMADVQCGKLLLARDYMNLRRKQLAEQLTGLKGWLGAS